MKKNILFIGVIFVCSLLFLGCPASVITSDSTGLELSITMPVVSKNRLRNVSRSTETDKYWEANFILQEQTKDEINVLQNLSLQLNQGENATVKFEKIDIDRTVRVVVEILSIETESLCYIGESDWHKVNAGSNHIVIELNKLVSAQSPEIEEHPKSIIKVYGDETEKEPAVGTLSVKAKVLDEGILSYQWYKCDDLQKSNPQLLQGETNSEKEVNEENISYYYCEVVNTNNSASGKKVSVVETNVVTVASVVGELKEIKSEYDDTKYEIYGEQIDYQNILITEVYYNSIVNQEVEVKLCADSEKYTIETDHNAAFGYVPYTVKHKNNTQLQSNVRILVKYEPQITIDSDNHVEGVDGTSEEKAVPISQYIEVLKIKPSVSYYFDVFKTNNSETAERINFEEYITFEEGMPDGTIIIQSFDDNIFCEEGNQSYLIKGKVTNTNIMDLIIEPEIEYYVNVIPLTIELTDAKTDDEIGDIRGGAQYNLSLKDRKNYDVEGVTYSIDEESEFKISDNYSVKIPAQLPIAQNCTVKAKKNGKEIAIKELVLPADEGLYEVGLSFDSQNNVLIIEKDEGLETFVTIINKTMTEPLFVKNSDNSENYKTFIADGNYSSISAELSNDVTLSDGISIGCSSDTPYRGVFDGNGKTIKIRNVKFETIQDDGIVTFGNALFGYTENATIKNLTVATKEDEDSGLTEETIEVTIREGNILQTVYLGGIIGNAKTTTLEQCINYRKLYIAESCDADNFYCAGLVAYAQDKCTYDKCINIGSIYFTNEKLLCGFENGSENVGSTFTDCLNCGSIYGPPNSFGFAKGGIYTNCVDVGDAGTPFTEENAYFSNCYYSGDVLPGDNIGLTKKSKLEIIEFTTNELPNWIINKAPYIYPLPFDVSNCENYPELFCYDLKISDVDTLRTNLETPENEESIIFVDIEDLGDTQITINRPVVLLADKTKTLTLSTTDSLFVPRQNIKLCGFNFNGNSNSCSVIDNSDPVEVNFCYSIELSNCMFTKFGQESSDKKIINISQSETSLKLDGCKFENNNQICIFLDNGTEAIIENSFFNNNVVNAPYFYASCIISYVKTNIQKSNFKNNEADKIITSKEVYGGAISLYGVDFTVSGCVFENDTEKSICDIYVNGTSTTYNYLTLDGKVDISAIIVSDYEVSKIKLGDSFEFVKKDDDDMIDLYGTSAKEDMFEITEAFDPNQLNLFNFIPGSIP